MANTKKVGIKLLYDVVKVYEAHGMELPGDETTGTGGAVAKVVEHLQGIAKVMVPMGGEGGGSNG